MNSPYPFMKKKSLAEFFTTVKPGTTLPLVTGVLTGIGLLQAPVAARTFQVDYFTSGTSEFTQSDFNTLVGNPIYFTEVYTNDATNSYFDIIGASGADTVLKISSNGSSVWDMTSLNCPGNVNYSDCNSLLSDPYSYSPVFFATAENGAHITLGSTDPANRLKINTVNLALAVRYNNESEAVNNNTEFTIRNVDYRMGTDKPAITDNLTRYVGNAPYTQKSADKPFDPNFIIENTSVFANRIASFTHSDVYIKDSQFLTPIPEAYIPIGAERPPIEQISNATSCGTCYGFTIIARNARVVMDNVFIRTAGDAISLLTGPMNTYLDNGNFGTLDIKNSELITYKQYGGGIDISTGTRSTAKLVHKLYADNIKITTYGLQATGLFSNYSNGSIKNSTITTYGDASYGIHNDVHGFYTIENTHITTYGEQAHGAIATATTSYGTPDAVSGPLSNTFINGSVTTYGNNVYGIYSGTVSTGITPTVVSITGDLTANSATDFTGGYRLNAYGNASKQIGILAGASGDASGIAASLAGTNSNVVYVSGYLVNGANTFRSSFTLDNAVLNVTGANSNVFFVNNGGVMEAKNLYATTSGLNSAFLVQQGSTIAHIDTADVALKNDSSHLVVFQGASKNARPFSSPQSRAITGGVTESGTIDVDKSTPIAAGNAEEKILLIENSLLRTEKGMGFVVLGGEANTLRLNNVTVETGTALAENQQWLLYVDNYRTFNAFNTPTGNFATNSLLFDAKDSYLHGSIYLKGDSAVQDVSLDHTELYGHVHLVDNSKLDDFTLTNESLWKGATFADTNQRYIKNLAIDATSTWEIYGGQTSTLNGLQNLGTMRFNAAGSNFQTVRVEGDYEGGGSIIMNGKYRTDGADSLRDQLYITGNVLGAPTMVSFVSVDNIGAQTVGNGIPVIQVDGISQTTDFQQQGTLYAGLYEYTLRAGKTDGTIDGIWYLSSDFNPPPVPPDPPPPPVQPPPQPPGPPPVDPPIIIPPAPPPIIVPPSTPNYRPDVVVSSIIPSLSYASGMAQLATYQERIAGTDDQTAGSGQWFRHFHQRNQIEYGNDGTVVDKIRVFEDNGANYTSTLHGFQVGMDLYRSDEKVGANGNPNFTATLNPMQRAGIFFGLGRSRANVDAVLSDTEAGNVRMTNLTAGAYYTQHFENGWYSDSAVAVNIMPDIQVSTNDSDSSKSKGTSWMLSTEWGYRHAISEEAFIEPQVQLVYQNMQLKDHQLAPDLGVAFNKTDALTTRVGVRMGTRFGEDRSNTAYVRVNWEQSHQSKADLRYMNPQIGTTTERVLHNEMNGSWITVDAGINGKLAEQTVGYIAVDYAKGIGNSEGSRFGLKVGFQHHF